MKLVAFLTAILLPCAGLAADFAAGDRVSLIDDTPLYFNKTTILRTGKRGEQFTIIAARPGEHRVFLSAKDVLGKDIALNVGDDAVVLIKKGVMAPGARDGMEVMGDVRKDLAAALKNPPTIMARRSKAGRERAMADNGGKKQSEEAVLKGLKWLKENQNPDGSWGPSYQGAMTGFAMLCFLGHGVAPDSADWGPTVQKGLDWLVENGEKNDGRLNMAKAFDMPGVYAHAIAANALCEYCTMIKDERVAELCRKAIGYIVAGQGPDGGWMYSYDKTEGDTSVSGWQIQALRAAHLSGLNIDGVDAALDKAMLNLKRVQAKDGSFGYRTATGGNYSLTGAGVFCICWWSAEKSKDWWAAGKNKAVQDGLQFLFKPQTDQEHPVDYHFERADLYAWYYNTHACFMVGGAAWQKWNPRIQDQLVKNQKPDGSWLPIAGKSPGGELQRDEEGAGPCYRTCLCTLMLEVFYRIDPIRK